MPRSDSSLRLLWIGATTGPCAQLLARVTDHCHRSGRPLEIMQSSELPNQLHSGRNLSTVDRIVIACDTRVHYPSDTIARLQCADLGIPWGVVTGTWLIGSRRTGYGPVLYWQQPWFRWWESWRGWFFPGAVRTANLSTNVFQPVITPIDMATPPGHSCHMAAERWRLTSSSQPRLAIASACRDSTNAWQSMAELVGWSCMVSPNASFESSDESRLGEVECILWDDSLLSRLPGIGWQATVQQASDQCQMLKRRWPGKPLVAALSLADIGFWPELARAGVDDFFIKPSSGLPLCDYLHWLATEASGQYKRSSEPTNCAVQAID